MVLKECQNKDLGINERVKNLLSQMTIEEKVAQLGSFGPKKILENGKFSIKKAKKVLKDGIGQITRIASASGLEPKVAAETSNQVQDYLINNTRLGIPAIIHEECLSGLMARGATVYPQSIGIGSTWDTDLLERITTEIRKQLRAIGAHLALSPLADVARDFRWGRTEETFGEDQYLVAEMVAAYVKGLQGNNLKEGIIATLKHFAGHGQPEGGRNHAPVNISPREFRETFLFPFEAGIRVAGAGSVMNAYHDIDGIPCAISRELLTDILRGEWGFDGIVVSDYWSIRMVYTDHKVAKDKQEAGIQALEAGLDIELPETECYGEKLIDAVHKGLISETVIDESVRRHLKAKFQLGLFEEPFVDTGKVIEVFETNEQRELAREAAVKSMVLLKNEDNLLPLDKNINSLAVIGPSADSTRNLLGDYAYSAHMETKEDAIPIVGILDGIKNKVSNETKIEYARGCNIMDPSKEKFAEAIEIAKNADVAIVVVGGKSGLSGIGDSVRDEEVVDFSERGFNIVLSHTTDTSGEGHDRTNLKLPGVQLALVEAIQKTGTPVVVVLANGRPLSIEWIAANIPTILEAWLPGEEGGNAVADVLFGEYNPGGKLPVSILRNVGQTPVNYNRKYISHNRDYVFTDNRPLFPFGYGLSYTKFEYDNLKISPTKVPGISEVTIEVDVKNVGEYEGDEIVQLYLHDVLASRTRPIKELKGFKRVSLKPGEKKTIKFNLSTEQLAFYDKDMNLIVEPGTFEVMVGSSSEDIRLKGKFEVVGNIKKVGYNRRYFTKVE